MVKYDIDSATTSTTTLEDYSVDSVQIDSPADQKETYWDNANASQYWGYYKSVPEYKTAINAYATWVVGKGWTADNRTTTILEGIRGWGEDTFLSIMWNGIVTKKVQGRAFIEIIRNPDTGTLINLKPLDEGMMRTVVNRKGIIIRYEQTNPKQKGAAPKIFQPEQILHLVNDRVADEIHGTAITESVEWVLLAMREAATDYRKVLHRNVNPLKIFEVEADNTIKLANIKTQYQTMTKDYEALFIPSGTMKLTIPTIPLQDPIPWMRYLDKKFYDALGVPKVILGGSEEFTEASSKIGYLTFEQVYSREVAELVADLWNQVALRLEFNKPASIKNELLQSEEKNTGQTGFQPKEATATLERE